MDSLEVLISISLRMIEEKMECGASRWITPIFWNESKQKGCVTFDPYLIQGGHSTCTLPMDIFALAVVALLSNGVR